MTIEEAEAIWSEGPRKFGGPGIPSVHVYADKAQPRYPEKAIPCASQSMPTDMREGTVSTEYGQKVRKHADGTMSTMDGRPIFDTDRNRKKHLERTGCVEMDEG